MSTIKPIEIKKVLDTARKIRQINGNFTPCFSGDSGIGKSKVVQAWVKEQGPDFKLIDLRLAYMEGPDMVGMPSHVVVDGQHITIHALPDFLPKNGEGLLFFEEPNRAHESVMNTLMQILTDRKIHNYTLPEGYVMAAAINPEGSYSVNNLDPAMRNRFAMFEVKYDHNSFVQYMKNSEFDSRLVAFADSGLWVYKSIDEIGDNGHYISPRSYELANQILKVNTDTEMEYNLITSVFGKAVASDFIKFINEIKPVLFEDFIKDKKDAFKRLQKCVSNKEYKGDLISSTVNSLGDAFIDGKCDIALVLEVANCLDKDQAANLTLRCLMKLSETEIEELFSKSKESYVKAAKARLKEIMNA